MPGSAAERAAAEGIKAALLDADIDFQILDYASVNIFDQSIPYSRSQVIYVPPDNADMQNFVTLALPLDQPDADLFPDLTAGLHMALEWILSVEERNFAVAFLGGEFYPNMQWGSHALAGSGLVSSSSPVIYLAIFDAASAPEIVSGSHGRISPRQLLIRLADSFSAHQVKPVFPGLKTTSYRLNRNTSLNLIGELMSQNIPAIGIEIGTPQPARAGEPNLPADIGLYGYKRPTATQSIHHNLAEEIQESLYSAISEPLDVTIWEELYGTIPWLGGDSIIIPESSYLLMILGIISFGFILAAQKRKLFRRYLHTVTRHSWLLAFVFLLLFSALILSTWVLNLILEIRDFPGLWEHYTVSFVVTKAVVGFLLSLILIRLFNRLPHIPHGRFYSAAAVVSSFISLIVLSSITLAYTYIFLISFLCTIAFSVSRRVRTKSLFLILSPLSLLLPLTGAIQAQDLRLIYYSLFSTVNGNVLLTILLLPYFLMGIRLHIMLHRRPRYRPTMLLRFSLLITTLAAASLIIILLQAEPFNEENPQKVEVITTISYPYDSVPEILPAIIEVISDAPIDSPLIYAFDRRVDNDGPQFMDLSYSELPAVTTEISTQRILQRQEVVLGISGNLPDTRISYNIHSDTPLFFHYSDLPVRLGNGRQTANFDSIPAAELPVQLVQVVAGMTNPIIRLEQEFDMPSEYLFTPHRDIHLQGRMLYQGDLAADYE